jgi:hypothetical protein
MIKPAKAAAPARGASAPKAPASAAGLATVPPPPSTAKSAGGGNIIYRHRAELTVAGNFGTLLGYLQTLQRLPGDLHWNSLQLDVAGYPQASVRLSLYTLSNRAAPSTDRQGTAELLNLNEGAPGSAVPVAMPPGGARARGAVARGDGAAVPAAESMSTARPSAAAAPLRGSWAVASSTPNAPGLRVIAAGASGAVARSTDEQCM